MQNDAHLVLWIDAHARIVDAGIYSEFSPTVASFDGELPLAIRVVSGNGIGYEAATRKLLRSVFTNVAFERLRGMKTLVRQRDQYGGVAL